MVNNIDVNNACLFLDGTRIMVSNIDVNNACLFLVSNIDEITDKIILKLLNTKSWYYKMKNISYITEQNILKSLTIKSWYHW
jgi:hypothetical protein